MNNKFQIKHELIMDISTTKSTTNSLKLIKMESLQSKSELALSGGDAKRTNILITAVHYMCRILITQNERRTQKFYFVLTVK